MSLIDWSIIAAYLVWIIWDGIRLTKKSNELEGYLLASRSLPWWAVGLSVMATQLSAITMIGTTGQGYADGMQFLQFYFALPIAMIVLSLTLVPFFHNARVFTAYEYLERSLRRQDADADLGAVPAVAGDGTGAVVSAPAVFLSVVLGLSVTNHVPADGAADRHLHHVRRRPGGGLDRRQADGASSSAACWRRWSRWWSACPTASASVTRCSLAGTVGRLQMFDFQFSTSPIATRSGRARWPRSSCSAPTSAPTRARCSAISRPSRSTRRARRC